MRHLIIGAVACLSMTAFVGTATAANAADTQSLSLVEVLNSSRDQLPQIRKSLAEREAERAALLAARGAFDLQLKAESQSRASGFYDGNVLKGRATQPFRTLGSSVYSEYKVSEGTFPIYEDEFFSNTGGTVKLGVEVPLLRDRAIDKARFGERDSELSLQAADSALLMTQLQVQRNAALAYWRWVAMGRQLEVYESLLQLANRRDSALRAQVEKGARAPIHVTENRQNLLRRQARVEAARRDFITAGNELSFYLRDSDGQTRPVDASLLPAYKPLASAPPEMTDAEATWKQVRLRSPERQLRVLKVARLEQKLRLQRNYLLPEVDLKLEVADGLGAIAEGGRSRDTTDTIVVLSVSVPLQRRQARGQLSATEAELVAAEQDLRQTEDRLRLELLNIAQELKVAERLYQLTAEEAEQAQVLRVAEVKRFENGASDFFLVNLREDAAANARVRYHEASMRARIAQSDYAAASVDLHALGLLAAEALTTE